MQRDQDHQGAAEVQDHEGQEGQGLEEEQDGGHHVEREEEGVDRAGVRFAARAVARKSADLAFGRRPLRHPVHPEVAEPAGSHRPRGHQEQFRQLWLLRKLKKGEKKKIHSARETTRSKSQYLISITALSISVFKKRIKKL